LCQLNYWNTLDLLHFQIVGLPVILDLFPTNCIIMCISYHKAHKLVISINIYERKYRTEDLTGYFWRLRVIFLNYKFQEFMKLIFFVCKKINSWEVFKKLPKCSRHKKTKDFYVNLESLKSELEKVPSKYYLYIQKENTSKTITYIFT